MAHYNANGEICNCGFGQYNEQVDESLVKEAGAKLDWIREREDNFFKTEEGQAIFRSLEGIVERDEKIDPLVPWLWREAKKKRLRPRDVDPIRLSHIADWYASNSPTRRGVDIMQLDVDQLAAKIDEWDEELRSKSADLEKAGGQVVAEVGDGWTIRQLTNAEEATVEGDAMRHCVGGYGSAIENGRTLIYSLRDEQNLPHTTIEIRPAANEYNNKIMEQMRSRKRVKDVIAREKRIFDTVREELSKDELEKFIEDVAKNHNVDPEELKAAYIEHYYGKPMEPIPPLSPDGGEIVQIQGKQNREPIPEYQELVGNWLVSLENPPEVYAQKTVAKYYAPESVWGLEDFALGQQEPHYEYTNVKVAPKSWEEYFKGGSVDEDYDEYETVIYPIEDGDWKSIVKDIFYSPEDMVEKADSFNNSLGIGLQYGYLDPEDVTKARNFAYDYVQKHYKEFETNLPGGYRTLYEAWKFSPYGQAADTAIGADFIARNTDEPIYEYYGPVEPNPNQNELFGPGQEPDVAPAGDEPIPFGEPDVPWNDPRNLDNQAGRFGKLFKRFRRKANILDPISDKLDPNIWEYPNNPRPILKEEVKIWITDTIAAALSRHGYTHMEDWMSLVLTGSLTTYQYSKSSDCDISVFVNAEMFPEWSRAEMISILMDECDNKLVPGTRHPLQCYVVANEFTKEDLYQPGMRSAYDITISEWVVAPEKDRVHDVKKEMNEAYTIALENADKMEKLIRYEPMKAIQYYDQIHMRRRKDMLAGKGDFTPSNISYKMMDNRGLFDQIKNLEKEYLIK